MKIVLSALAVVTILAAAVLVLAFSGDLFRSGGGASSPPSMPEVHPAPSAAVPETPVAAPVPARVTVLPVSAPLVAKEADESAGRPPVPSVPVAPAPQARSADRFAVEEWLASNFSDPDAKLLKLSEVFRVEGKQCRIGEIQTKNISGEVIVAAYVFRYFGQGDLDDANNVKDVMQRLSQNATEEARHDMKELSSRTGIAIPAAGQ